MVGVDFLKLAHLFHEQLDRHDAEKVGDMGQMRNGEYEVILTLRNGFLFVCSKS